MAGLGRGAASVQIAGADVTVETLLMAQVAVGRSVRSR
jgi:hypothetical protein